MNLRAAHLGDVDECDEKRRAAAAGRGGGPRVIAFVHVPQVRRAQVRSRWPALTLDDLTAAGEAVVRAALAAAR